MQQESLKETLLHILFVGVLLYSTSFLKKDTRDTTKKPDTQAQTTAPVLAMVRDTVHPHIRK
jgi:hypothetical protein